MSDVSIQQVNTATAAESFITKTHSSSAALVESESAAVTILIAS